MIRLATVADAPAITALVRLAYAPFAARIGVEPMPMLADYAALAAAGQTSVLERDGMIAAVLVIEPHPDHLLVENVAVHPQWQRHGLGRGLMAHAETEARRRGLDLLRLYTNVAMTENIALYERLGYVETHRGVEDGRHRVFMEKRIPTTFPSRN